MGKNTDRDWQIYIDRTRKAMTYDQIARKYGITRERVRQILLKEFHRYGDGSDTYSTLLRYFPDNQNIVVRALNGFIRSFIKDDDKKRAQNDFAFFCEKLSEVPEEKLMGARNLGIKSVDFLKKVQAEYGTLKARQGYTTVNDLICLLLDMPRSFPVIVDGFPLEGKVKIVEDWPLGDSANPKCPMVAAVYLE